MAKKDQVADIPEKDENITEIDVSDEMRGSFLEYAVSVIYARALPDARDGDVLHLVDAEEPPSGSGAVMLGMPTIPRRRAAFR